MAGGGGPRRHAVGLPLLAVWRRRGGAAAWPAPAPSRRSRTPCSMGVPAGIMLEDVPFITAAQAVQTETMELDAGFVRVWLRLVAVGRACGAPRAPRERGGWSCGGLAACRPLVHQRGSTLASAAARRAACTPLLLHTTCERHDGRSAIRTGVAHRGLGSRLGRSRGRARGQIHLECRRSFVGLDHCAEVMGASGQRCLAGCLWMGQSPSSAYISLYIECSGWLRTV